MTKNKVDSIKLLRKQTRFTKNEECVIKHGFYRGETVKLTDAYEDKDTGDITYKAQFGKETLDIPEYLLKRKGLITRMFESVQGRY